MYYTTPLLLQSLRPQHLRAASLQLDSLLHHHLTYERIFLRQCIPGILGHQGILSEGLLVQCVLGEGIPRANLTFADIKSWSTTHPSGSNCAPSMGNSMQRKQIRTRSKVKVSSSCVNCAGASKVALLSPFSMQFYQLPTSRGLDDDQDEWRRPPGS